MSDIKTLKAYAEGRKLPPFKLLARLPNKWIEYVHDIYTQTPISDEHARQQREHDRIIGTKVENYDSLTQFYNQLYPSSITTHELYNTLSEPHHFRFGRLKSRSTIPMHLDEPFTLRGLCVIKGQHRFVCETGHSVVMNPGELYFLNGCFRHSVENTLDSDRIALLNKFRLNLTNKNTLLNELL
jgi:hypothetical protein